MTTLGTTAGTVVLVALSVTATGLGQRSASAQQSDDLKAVNAVHEAFHEAFGNEDIDLMSEVWLHDDSVRLIVPPAEQPLEGWETIKASFEGTFAELEVLSLSMDDVQVIVGPEFAWIVEVHGFEMKLPDGNVIKAPFFASNVLQKVDGDWYMVHHHASAPPPAQQ